MYTYIYIYTYCVLQARTPSALPLPGPSPPPGVKQEGGQQHKTGSYGGWSLEAGSGAGVLLCGFLWWSGYVLSHSHSRQAVERVSSFTHHGVLKKRLCECVAVFNLCVINTDAFH